MKLTLRFIGVLHRSGPSSAAPILGVGSALCAALILLGSFAHGTTRAWVKNDRTRATWTEGAARWAAWTFLCGLVLLALLVFGAWLRSAEHRRLSAACAFLAVAPFIYAANRANSHWQRLQREQDQHFTYPSQDVDYTLNIAAGLPIVVISAAVGAVLALTLALLWATRRPSHSADRSTIW